MGWRRPSMRKQDWVNQQSHRAPKRPPWHKKRIDTSLVWKSQGTDRIKNKLCLHPKLHWKNRAKIQHEQLHSQSYTRWPSYTTVTPNVSNRNPGKGRHNKVLYREAVGCLIYAGITTSPNISYAVGQVSRFCENPGKPHWTAVKHIISSRHKKSRYLFPRR